MEKKVRETSKNVYEKMKKEGTLKSQKGKIYNLVDIITNNRRAYGVTLKELSRKSGLEINAVSGRVNDLKKEGLLSECQKRKCTITNRTVIPVTIGSGDVGGPSHSNLNEKKHIQEKQTQEGFDFGKLNNKYDGWPD